MFGYRQTDIVSLARMKNKVSDILISGNDCTQEPEDPSKKAKVDSSIDEKNTILKNASTM